MPKTNIRTRRDIRHQQVRLMIQAGEKECDASAPNGMDENTCQKVDTLLHRTSCSLSTKV